MTDGWTNWETKEAFQWLASSPDEGRYLEAKEKASESLREFEMWAEETLSQIDGWDNSDTPDVNFTEIMEAVLEE